MSLNFSEFVVGQAALAWLEAAVCRIEYGPRIAAGELLDERKGCSKFVPETCLLDALVRLNAEPRMPCFGNPTARWPLKSGDTDA